MGDLGKQWQYSLSVLSRSLLKSHTIVFCESLSFIYFDAPLIFQIVFISNKNYLDVFLTILLNTLHPLRNVFETFPTGNVVHEQNSTATSEVVFCKGVEVFLSSCVPDLNHNFLFAYLHFFSNKFYTQGAHRVPRKSILAKALENARFSYTCISHHYIFEQVVESHIIIN